MAVFSCNKDLNFSLLSQYCQWNILVEVMQQIDSFIISTLSSLFFLSAESMKVTDSYGSCFVIVS